MARITVEDCLKRVPNRFVLVNMAAKRVRQIREGAEYLVNSPKNEDIVVSLREIAAGKIRIKEQTAEEIAAADAEAAAIPETTESVENDEVEQASADEADEAAAQEETSETEEAESDDEKKEEE